MLQQRWSVGPWSEKDWLFFFPDRWIYKKQFKLVSCRISVCNFTLHRVGGVTLPLNCNILHCFKSSFGGILILTISNHPIYIYISNSCYIFFIINWMGFPFSVLFCFALFKFLILFYFIILFNWSVNLNQLN
jgi:hypothetical protein